ncbi:MAG: class I SAM-dependent methyltransferase [Solirubrobacterales bacterium]
MPCRRASRRARARSAPPCGWCLVQTYGDVYAVCDHARRRATALRARVHAEVTEVIAMEPEPTLRAAAERAAADAPVPVRVMPGVADDLPLEDASADAVVASLVLCSVPDRDQALADLRRVLRPAGDLRFYEHVIPRSRPRRLLLQGIARRP